MKGRGVQTRMTEVPMKSDGNKLSWGWIVTGILLPVLWLGGFLVLMIFPYWSLPAPPVWGEHEIRSFIIFVGLGGALGTLARYFGTLIWYITHLRQNPDEKANVWVFFVIKPLLMPFAGAIVALAFVLLLQGLITDFARAFGLSIAAGLFTDNVMKAIQDTLRLNTNAH